MKVENIDFLDAMEKYKGQYQTLLVSWIPNNLSNVNEMLDEKYGCDKYIIIGEGYDGCCAQDSFYEVLYENFDLVDNCSMYNTWQVYGYLQLYTRKQKWIEVKKKRKNKK